MNIRINAIHFDASAQLESFIEKKVKKLDRYTDEILLVEVFLKVVRPETSENKDVEIKVTVPNSEMFVHKQADSFEEAVDLGIESLKRQVQKHKEKVRGV